ncbi:MAG: hypothetical protein ACI9JN_000542 [Bacteroidia bacterium]|jgi:hypothetical protein
MFCLYIPGTERDPRIILVGKTIRALRIAKGFTSSEAFAWEHGINRVQHWRMENGQNFTLDSLFKVLDAMEVSSKDFFGSFD